jgi:hypothetical protein
MVWHPVRNEGRLPCGGPSHKDDLLERVKAAREEKQLEKIRVKVEGWEQSGRHGVAPGKEIKGGYHVTAHLTRKFLEENQGSQGGETVGENMR